MSSLPRFAPPTSRRSAPRPAPTGILGVSRAHPKRAFAPSSCPSRHRPGRSAGPSHPGRINRCSVRSRLLYKPAMEPDFLSVRGAREHNLKNIIARDPEEEAGRLHRRLRLAARPRSPSTPSTPRASAATSRASPPTRASSSGRWRSPSTTPSAASRPPSPSSRRRPRNNPRSTVGTVTEIHDYLRVLYARVGVQHCHHCGRPVGKQTAQQIVEEILKLPGGHEAAAARAAGAEPQGRAPGRARATRASAASPACASTARLRSLEDEDRARQEDQARHRAGGRPPGGEARHRAAPHRLGRDGAARRQGLLIVDRREAAASTDRVFERAERLPPLRHLASASSRPQRSPSTRRSGMCHGVQRPRHPAGDGPGPDRPGPDHVHPRGRGRAVGARGWSAARAGRQDFVEPARAQPSRSTSTSPGRSSPSASSDADPATAPRARAR